MRTNIKNLNILKITLHEYWYNKQSKYNATHILLPPYLIRISLLKDLSYFLDIIINKYNILVKVNLAL